MSAQQQINKNPEQKEEVKQVNLLDIEIKNENDALNVMVGFHGGIFSQQVINIKKNYFLIVMQKRLLVN